MTLMDPREALADQNNFIGYLLGLAGLSHAVRRLGVSDARSDPAADADDFVQALLGIASLGDRIERLVEPAATSTAPIIVEPVLPRPWLR